MQRAVFGGQLQARAQIAQGCVQAIDLQLIHAQCGDVEPDRQSQAVGRCRGRAGFAGQLHGDALDAQFLQADAQPQRRAGRVQARPAPAQLLQAQSSTFAGQGNLHGLGIEIAEQRTAHAGDLHPRHARQQPGRAGLGTQQPPQRTQHQGQHGNHAEQVADQAGKEPAQRSLRRALAARQAWALPVAPAAAGRGWGCRSWPGIRRPRRH